MKQLRIVYLGTPDFAVLPLKMLVEKGFEVAGVVTAPDKPAGRGQKLQYSAVKEYALSANLRVLQPEKLKSPDFLEELKALEANLQIVVAFRMLPEQVWSMPELGTFNLHASLLPQYRGAAPINRAIMNGEKVTGVTTFFLKHEIDTGNVIFREKVEIGEDETAGELHDRLMITGAELVLKTVKAIEAGSYSLISQEELVKPGEVLHHAPKIFRDDCRINWNTQVEKIHDFIRGLSPYPAAFFNFSGVNGEEMSFKVFRSAKEIVSHGLLPGELVTDNRTYLKVAAQNGFIVLKEVQLQGKKRMSMEEFLRGFQFSGQIKV
jgi:methionyl-tRNA formyltransferase